MLKRQKKKLSAFETAVLFILILYSFLLIFLFVWAFLSSFRIHGSFRKNPFGVFSEFRLSNYINVFATLKVRYIENKQFVTIAFDYMFFNSLIYAGAGALITLFFTSAVAYITAKYKCAMSSFIRNLVIITLIVPVVGTLPSLLSLLKSMKLYNTWPGIFLQRITFFNTYYLIFYAAFQALSWEYAEAAFIDGASHSCVFFRIMLPLAVPLCMTVFILLFVSFWNDYQTPWMLIPDKPTAARGLYYYLNEMQINDIPSQLAAGVVLFLPVFVIFVSFRNKIMGNLTEGGIKG